jgi:small subunit ribosomal protein S16
MEVRIRLQKAGKTSSKVYNYRIVAMSRNEGRDGRNLEILGYYDPAKKPASVSIDHEKLQKWVEKGAQMSDTVRSLVKKNVKK